MQQWLAQRAGVPSSALSAAEVQEYKSFQCAPGYAGTLCNQCNYTSTAPRYGSTLRRWVCHQLGVSANRCCAGKANAVLARQMLCWQGKCSIAGKPRSLRCAGTGRLCHFTGTACIYHTWVAC
jgi:hypothetical protein